MSKCKDCGCYLNAGICSNCHEEYYIATFQAEYIEEPLSEEFVSKIEEQKTQVAKNQNDV